MEIGFIDKTMSDEVKTIYTRLYKILCIHTKLNMLAMSSLQAMGYNGFKRWHRCRVRKFMELKLKLRCEMYDRFRIKADFKDVELTYDPSSMEEHLKSWEKAILDGVKEIGTISKDFYSSTGVQCEIASCMMDCMMKDYEKVTRYLKRFTESDWLTLDMHIVDDALHCKYKTKEKEHGYDY